MRDIKGEEERLAALRGYGILDTGPEANFDQVVRLAARLLDVPIALISLVDQDRQWFKAAVGLDGVTETPRELAFCDHAIRGQDVMVVPDATEDPRFAENPLVTGEPGIRFYAGAPLITPDGHALGTLCVIDRVPHRALSDHDAQTLTELTCFVRDKLELRREALRSKALVDQAALIARLMSAAAEAPDFASAIHAAAEAIADATGGLFCHVWRLSADGQRAIFVSGAGVGVLGLDTYFDLLRSLVLTPANSQVATALVRSEQIWSPISPGPETASRPAANLAAEQGVTLQLATPFGLGEERYVFSVGLAASPEEPEAVARLMREATAALRPMLRRHLDEADGRLYRRLIATSENGVLVSEPPFEEPGPRIIFANPAFERMSGYSLAEIKGHSPRFSFGPESDQQSRLRIRAEIKAGRSVTEEVLQYRKDGTTYWTSLRIIPVLDSSGVATHYISAQTDITAAREARLERDALTRDLQTLVAAIPGVLMRHRPRTDILWDRTFIAPGVEALTGYTVEEASILGWWVAGTSEPDHTKLYAALNDAVGGGQSRTDFHFRRKDGNCIWIRILMRGNIAPDGEREVISIWSDISEEYRMAAEREAKTRELETVMATIPGVIIRTRREPAGSWKRIQVSRSVTELTGHSVEEAMEEDWWTDNVEPATALRANAFFRAADVMTPREGEFRFRHKLGHWNWIRRRSRGYVDEHGVEELVSIWNDVTEQKTLMLEREELTADLQRVVTTMPGVLMRIHKNEGGRWVRHFISPSIEALTGFTVEEAQRADWLPDNLDPADRASMLALLAKGDPTAPATTYFRFRHKQGHTIWIMRNTRGYVDADGRVEVISIWNDITAEKRLLLDREELANDLQAVIKVMPGGLIRARLSRDHTWLHYFVSAGTEVMTGYTIVEMVQPDWARNTLHPDDRPALEASLKSEAAGLPTTLEFRLRHKQGHYIRINRRTSSFRNAEGEMELVVVWTDVTAERQLLADRDELASDLQAVMDAMPGVLMRIRNRGDHWDRIYVGPGIEALTGHSVAEAMQPEWVEENLDPAERGLLVGQMRGQFAVNQLSVEFRFRHKKGHWIWIRRIARGHMDPDGTREVIAIWNDVTREKSLAEQFAQSAKLAQLGEVATGMAHELNQPLAGISLAAENALRSLARLPEPPQRAREKLALIVDLTKRASDIIDHMRIFGRSETAIRGAVSLAEVVKGAGQLLASKLNGGGVRLQAALPEDLPPVLGKAVPLEQVIMNLISNACDAYSGLPEPVPSERRVIGVSAHAEADWVTIEVQDAAGGIPEEVLPRIFEPFFTTKRVGEGTGLGLSISYGIISDMGGTITAENHAGGCLMRILLPLAR